MRGAVCLWSQARQIFGLRSSAGVNPSIRDAVRSHCPITGRKPKSVVANRRFRSLILDECKGDFSIFILTAGYPIQSFRLSVMAVRPAQAAFGGFHGKAKTERRGAAN